LSRNNIPAGLPAVLAADHVEFFMLVKLEFDSETLYISGCDFNVEYDSHTWLTLRGLGSVDAIVESGDEIPGITLTLSGVPNESIIHAQSEHYRNRKVSIQWAFFNGDAFVVDPSCWLGFMDTPIITRSKDTCTIQVSCENRMIDWQRPRGRIFNHADQQRVLSGDEFFLGIESMVEREIILFKGDAGGSTVAYPPSNEAPSGVVSAVAPVLPPVEGGGSGTPTDDWVDGGY
jgi:hypothetical protein